MTHSELDLQRVLTATDTPGRSDATLPSLLSLWTATPSGLLRTRAAELGLREKPTTMGLWFLLVLGQGVVFAGLFAPILGTALKEGLGSLLTVPPGMVEVLLVLGWVLGWGALLLRVVAIQHRNVASVAWGLALLLPLALLLHLLWTWLALPPLVALVILVGTTALSLCFTRRAQAPQPPPVADLVGYELKEVVGVGGMGQVWRAEHRMLGRPAAIKIIKPSILSASRPGDSLGLDMRFEREATLTASLRSPHTVSLHDFGRTAGGSLYYVMEFLEGVSLQRLIEEEGPLLAPRVVHILKQVCASLSEAHDRQIVHQDLKPANVMISPRVGRELDHVTVLDFGLARRLGEGGELAEGALGTPAYMPPEQAQGSAPTPRTDLYALGCLAYSLLTGSLVFEGLEPRAMIRDHLSREPKRPSDRLRLALEPGLEGLVMACLAKDPSARPVSADEVIRRLEACEVGKWSREEASAWWSQHDARLRHPLGCS